MPMVTALESAMSLPSSKSVIPPPHHLYLLPLQVYYIPIWPFYNQVTLPVMLTALPLIRDILIRERITVLHGHGVGQRGGPGGSFSVCVLAGGWW